MGTQADRAVLSPKEPLLASASDQLGRAALWTKPDSSQTDIEDDKEQYVAIVQHSQDDPKGMQSGGVDRGSTQRYVDRSQRPHSGGDRSEEVETERFPWLCTAAFRSKVTTVVSHPSSALILIATFFTLGLTTPQCYSPQLCTEAFGDSCFSYDGYFRTAETVASLLSMPIAGYLVDWYGPRKIMCWCVFVSALPGAVYLLSNDAVTYYISKSTHGLFGGGHVVVLSTARGCLAVVTPTKYRTTVFAFFGATFGVATMIAGCGNLTCTTPTSIMIIIMPKIY